MMKLGSRIALLFWTILLVLVVHNDGQRYANGASTTAAKHRRLSGDMFVEQLGDRGNSNDVRSSKGSTKGSSEAGKGANHYYSGTGKSSSGGKHQMGGKMSSSRTRTSTPFTSHAPSMSPSGQQGDEASPLVLLQGNLNEFLVVSCGLDEVIVKGNLTSDLVAGLNLIHLGGPEVCGNCLPLYRHIISVADGQGPDTKILTTSFLNLSQLLGDELVDLSMGDQEVEPLFGCHDDTTLSRRELKHDELKHDVLKLSHDRFLQQSVPRICDAWLDATWDGKCTYTNCFVGQDGSQSDCFVCGNQCDNGCGPAKFPASFSGEFLTYSFGNACCNHDHCWSSTFSRRQCDVAFYNEMESSCPRSESIFSYLPATTAVSSRKSCLFYARLFYVLVSSSTGDEPYADAVRKQKEHEDSDACCDIFQSDTECCDASDCFDSPDEYVCESRKCIAKGDPRFTLSWTGDDDLDLHVVTPGGVEVYYRNPYDSVSGGFLDEDDIPSQTGRWVENIYFPLDGSAPPGEYKFYVRRFNAIGDLDSWVLSAYFGETLMAQYSGLYSSQRYSIRWPAES